MERTLLIHPTILMMLLTLFLYIKNYLENIKAVNEGAINPHFFKVYRGDIPEIVEVSRQTLKNQFELPIFFYFLISLTLIFDKITIIDIICSWLFVSTRYLHCYIRLSSNYIPYRAKIFQLGLLILIVWWIIFLYSIL